MDTTSCCTAPMAMATATVASTPQVPVLRWRQLLDRAWHAWRERSRREAEWRTLAKLDERTRRDIGLAERALPSAGVPWDLERGRW